MLHRMGDAEDPRRWALGRDLSPEALRKRQLRLSSDWHSLATFEPEAHPQALDLSDILRALLRANSEEIAEIAASARKAVGMVPLREKRAQALDDMRRCLEAGDKERDRCGIPRDAQKDARSLLLMVLTMLPPAARAELAPDAPRLADHHARRLFDYDAIQPWIDRIANAIDVYDTPRRRIGSALAALGAPKSAVRNLFNFEIQRAKQKKLRTSRVLSHVRRSG